MEPGHQDLLNTIDNNYHVLYDQIHSLVQRVIALEITVRDLKIRNLAMCRSLDNIEDFLFPNEDGDGDDEYVQFEPEVDSNWPKNA